MKNKWKQLFPGVWKLEAGSVDVTLTGCAGNKSAPAIKDAVYTGNMPGIECEQQGDYWVFRLPLDEEEVLFGGGLLFKKSVLNHGAYHLRMDHSSGVDNGRSHAPVPFWVTSGGVGLFLDTPHEVMLYAACGKRLSDKASAVEYDRTTSSRWRCFSAPYYLEAAVRSPGIAAVLFAASDIKACVAKFNLYCGGGFIPPKWGLGLWHRTGMTMNDQQVVQAAEEYEKHDFPLSVIGLEPGWQSAAYPSSCDWSKDRFPQPKKLIADLERKGIRVNLWENPCISQKSSLYEELLPYAGSHLVWNGIIPDLTLPEVRNIIKKHHTRNHFDLGVSGYKLDESDGFEQWLWPDFARFPSGLDGFAYKSVCGVMFSSLTTEIYREHDRRTYGLTRSANAGAVSLPYVLYNDNYDFAQYLAAMCSSGFTGCLWTPELRQAATEDEWLKRFQLACVSPLLLVNAWATDAVPWMYPEVESAVREALALRQKLLPYIYSAFARYHFEGIPPWRSLFMDYGLFLKRSKLLGKLDDTANPYQLSENTDIVDQFIFGDTLMAAPLFPDCAGRRVIFPPGKWFDFYTGELVSSGGVLEISPEKNAPIPLFAPDGAVIPLEENGKLTVKSFGTKKGSFRLYCDDGITFAGENGQHEWKTITADGIK